MRVIRQSDYRVMPWKNGAGTTTEIHVSPGAGSTFNWRVSIATVNADGPFSIFAGYERHIMVLDGMGMTLQVGDRGSFDLAPLAPFTFAGDVAVTGLLTQGPVRDFNLMVRRDYGHGSLRVHHGVAPYRVASGQSLHLVHIIGGDSIMLVAGEEFAFAAGSILAICEVSPREPREPAA
jgi:uncharacterized protein